MKRILSLVMCLVLLCGCGGKTDETVGDTAHPVSAVYAETQTAVDFAYLPDSAEDACYVLFTANDRLTEVRLTVLEISEGDYGIGEQLCGFEVMEIGQTLLAPLVFYGDMTAYGVSFADSNGAYRNYAVTISGMDGSLLLQEFVP